MSEINPNHPMTTFARDHWYKLCALLVNRLPDGEARITAADIEALENSGRANITIREKNDVIILKLVSDEEAQRLARKEGGLPV